MVSAGEPGNRQTRVSTHKRGIFGSGFRQWLKLDQYLAANKIQIGKVVVLFISDDYHRSVWNFSPSALECFSTPLHCRVEEGYYYRLPPEEKLPSWLAMLRTARGPMKPRLEMRASALLPVSHSVYLFFKQIMQFPKAEQESRASIADLIRIYGAKNVAFLHLPEKHEVGHAPSGSNPTLGARA